MTEIIETHYPDLIIVNGKAINFIDGKIDTPAHIKGRKILNDTEIKAVNNYIKALEK